MKRRRNHWYIVTKILADELAAKGYPIKPKPQARVSGSNGAWMVLCDPTVLWQVMADSQKKIN